MGRKRINQIRLGWKEADDFISSTLTKERVSGLTHNYYKYPARFSPIFANSAINTFTDPGALVVDPFMGGGTTLVEARVAGRRSLGTDVSSLATFVSHTKTRLLTRSDAQTMKNWSNNLEHNLNLRNKIEYKSSLDKEYYQRNIDCHHLWPIKKSIDLALHEADKLNKHQLTEFARCAILRTAQWGLDGRKSYPTARSFRETLSNTIKSMLDGGLEYSSAARSADRITISNGLKRTLCINSNSDKISEYIHRVSEKGPKLVLTSPPYPGVHVLYHRWQIDGGRETPAPFWIANRLDGAGASYYTLGDRHENELTTYYRGIYETFSSLRNSLNKRSIVIQLLAFSDVDNQLPKYLSVMERSGYQENLLSEHLDTKDGRLWRTVPNRKWHATKNGPTSSAKEVVLIHKPC